MDLQGYRIGYLEVISKNSEDERTGTYWLCKCNCPECTSRRNKKLISIRQDKLLEGRTSSCGYSKELQKTRGNFETNKFDIKEDYCIGYTYKGDKFIFDLDDYDLVISVSKSWSYNDSGYVAARDKRKDSKKYKDGRSQYVYLKDVVMNKKPGQKVEYVNKKNKFDNRKSNLIKKG